MRPKTRSSAAHPPEGYVGIGNGRHAAHIVASGSHAETHLPEYMLRIGMPPPYTSRRAECLQCKWTIFKLGDVLCPGHALARDKAMAQKRINGTLEECRLLRCWWR